ncbi:MAG: hypothetical protein Q8920_09935 [Bacillota bacterium]|nr:hypothetical protein [Bacillota bacterium]
MYQNMDELKKKILQKNMLLDSIKHVDSSSCERALKVRNELDSLLYRYYKSLNCSR